MKQFSSVICVLVTALCALPLTAADKKKAALDAKPKAPGHLLYANTVGVRGWSFFVMDGEDVRPGGIEPGYRSAWVSYPPGKRQLQFEHQPLGLVDLEVDLQSGGLHVFVAYSDVVPQTERRRPPRPILAVKELRCDLIVPPAKRKSSHLVLLNLTPAPLLNIRIEEDTHELSRLQETVIKPGKRGGIVEVQVLPSSGLLTAIHPEPVDRPENQGAEPTQDAPTHALTLNFEDPGTRFLVFYTDAYDKVRSLLFDDIGMYSDSSDP